MENLPLKVRYAWLEARMPLTRAVLAGLPDLRGKRLVCSWHWDFKMLPVLRALVDKNASVFGITCNRFTVRQDVVDLARSWGFQVEASAGMSESEALGAIRKAVSFRPDYLCEMGGDVSEAIHSSNDPTNVKASLEATGSGTTKWKNRTPRYPIFDWDAVPIKTEIHNRIMVGLVACHTFFQRTQLTFHGKNVHVIGFGPVGEGVARAARSYGGKISVSDAAASASRRAAEAGFTVKILEDALPETDVVITATGARNVLHQAHYRRLKPGAFLINVGHGTDEIEVTPFTDRVEVLPFVEKVTFENRDFYLLARGSLLNLTAGIGDSLNCFDPILAVMSSGIHFMVREGHAYQNGLHLLPEKAWGSIDPGIGSFEGRV